MRPILLFFLYSAIVLNSSAAPQSKSKADEDQTIRADVEMVSLPVVVSTHEGRRVANLKKEDFRVFEDGIEQEIKGFAATDEPLNIALLLDSSSSTEEKLAKIKKAANDFVHMLHPDDEVAVISFAEDVRLQQDFSLDRDKIERGIFNIRSGGNTALFEAVWLGLEEVLKPVQERKALVIYSDGLDTCSHNASMKETWELSKETRATIYAVYYNTKGHKESAKSPGIQLPPILNPNPPRLPPIWDPGTRYPAPDPDPRTTYPPAYPPTTGPGSNPPTGRGTSTPEDYKVGREYLRELADNSGGMIFDGNTDLHWAFSEVAKELGNQYSIGYYPANTKHDGKFRKVEVKMKKPGLAVRTKKGYYAKKS
jgi:Ca-activated chloride channel homolog